MKDIPRPFLKWPGGKSKLSKVLFSFMPKNFVTYHEPFLGGGAFFFFLYRQKMIKNAVLSDVNKELIDTYLAIRDYVNDVIEILSGFPYSREFFYKFREKSPWELSLPERAARMIYLNKTGYNGHYRLNKQGKFNVPFGNYKSPNYLDKENLLAVSAALKNVEILQSPFEGVLERATRGDFVYFDPPYVPVSRSSFVQYFSEGFSLDDHVRLKNVVHNLTKIGVFIMLSNSDTPFVRSLYDSSSFFVEEVTAFRSIGASADSKRKVKELVIMNRVINH